jgi:hypothetical protein
MDGIRECIFDGVDDAQEFLDSKLDDIFDPLLGVDSREKAGSGGNRRLKKGDVIFTDRGLYKHYGVYAGSKKIIHYASTTGDFGDDICVHETTLDNFLKGGDCFAVDFPEHYDWGNGRKTTNIPTIFRPAIIPKLSAGGAVDLIGKIIKSSQYHLYSGEETVNRARSRIGENSYNLVFNNCEHFAVWCKTGISESKQVEEVLGRLAVIPVMAVL